MIPLTVGGVRYDLDASAMSAIRYRSKRGKSAIGEIVSAEGDMLPLLIRITYEMISGEKPDMRTYAYAARREEGFYDAALGAVLEMIKADPLAKPQGGKSKDAFDEFDLLAAYGRSGLPGCLLYELPILHIVSILNRMNPTEPTKRLMTNDEVVAMYPRRGKPKG